MYIVRDKATRKILHANPAPVSQRLEGTAKQVAEGLIELTPTQIVDGDQIREMTDGEKAAAGLIQLDPHLKLLDKRIVPKTPAEHAKELDRMTQAIQKAPAADEVDAVAGLGEQPR